MHNTTYHVINITNLAALFEFLVYAINLPIDVGYLCNKTLESLNNTIAIYRYYSVSSI